MKGSTHHRIHAVLTFIVAFVAGVILIPLLRVEPKSVHKFATGLTDWQRTGFSLILCVLYAHTMFKLFSPRLVHLRYLWTHPPTWFAWLAGIAVVGVIDVIFGLTGYQGTWREWVGYGAGSIGLVALYRHLSKSSSDERELKPIQQWIHAVVGLLTTVIAGVILIPLFRDEPQSIHELAGKLDDWLRIGLTFLLCLVVTYMAFRLLLPRFADTKRILSHPPVWIAVLLGVLVVASIDVIVCLNPDGYQGSLGEWLGYGAGSIVLVGLVHHLRMPKADDDATETDGELRLQDIENADWKDIESWLCSDAPAEYDFLGNRVVAQRLGTLLAGGTRSIGIVGPFGAGKTSIVEWFKEEIDSRGDDETTLFFSSHSCWGFENSASSIHEMLAQAIGVVEAEIDTFHVSSLPESYRQTFSAGGKWIDKISNLILGRRRPSEQFQSLSELLGDLDAKLVIVVEDLDRNNSRSFDIQEVLAFLQQLKEYDNLTFVLTGGLSSSREIDFAKLCDHIDFLRAVQPEESSGLIDRVCERCLDGTAFDHVRLGDPNRNYESNPLSGLMMRDYEELSLPQAVAALLNTPRSLRHALGRTVAAWRVLHGEVNFHHLLGLNILRFGAPESFEFLIRRWDRLRSPANQQPSFGRERIELIRQAIVDDWNETTQNVEWNPTAALQVMEIVLPATEYWLVDSSSSGHSANTPQGIHEERYWRRAVNESVDENDIRDQRVINEMGDWLDSPRLDSPLVNSLCTSEAFGAVWQDLAGNFLGGQPDQILLLCEHVLTRIRNDHRAAASRGSLGFEATCFFAERRISLREENAEWLRERITEACGVSLELVNGLWHFWSTGPSPIRRENRVDIRRHALSELRQSLASAEALTSRLHPDTSATLYKLVFDPGNEDGNVINDVASWSWLGPVILEALRTRDLRTAANVGVLLGARVSGRETIAVDTKVLEGFFGDDAPEVIEILGGLIDQVEDSEQSLIRNVIDAARQELAQVESGSDESEADANDDSET